MYRKNVLFRVVLILAVGLMGLFHAAPRAAQAAKLLVPQSAALYTQNFDTLTTFGTAEWMDDTTLGGWYANYYNGVAPLTYTVYDAESVFIASSLLSLGLPDPDPANPNPASADRALGTFDLENNPTAIGLHLINDTGAPISSLRVQYTGEQWASLGTTPQRIEFSYQVGWAMDNPFLIGGWTDVPGLRFEAPVVNGSGVVDGSLAENRQTLTAVIPVSMGIDDEIMLRWTRVGGEQTKQILGVDDVTVENVLPAVTSVSVPANATYKTGDPLDFTVMWNEAVAFHTTNGTPSFDLTIGSTVRKAVYLSGSGTSSTVFRYTVQSGELDSDGVSAGSVIALNGGAITASSVLAPAILTLNSVGATTGVLVEAVPPQVTSVGFPSSATYTAGQGLAFTVNWDEPVTVTGAPSIPLTVGSTTRQAVYESGSGSTAIGFPVYRPERR